MREWVIPSCEPEKSASNRRPDFSPETNRSIENKADWKIDGPHRSYTHKHGDLRLNYKDKAPSSLQFVGSKYLNSRNDTYCGCWRGGGGRGEKGG